jgi:murein DD-endopeptidase MepM/ murein hydrolase activator NlpD
VENGEPDIIPNSEEFSSLFGNYIFIKIDSTDTYLVLAHFMKESIVVSVGDHVTEGVVLGKVGNSRTTAEPHLHIQHQRENPLSMKFVICEEGLPIEFKNK